MKIKFTKSIIKEIAKLAENFVFAGVKEEVILDMEGLCQTVDMYRELHLKGQRYEGQPGKITINVPDELFPVMISTYGFRMVKESELDMATVGELCDIYKQLKSGSSEQVEEDSAVEENSEEEPPVEDELSDDGVVNAAEAEEDFADTDSEDTAEDGTEDTDPAEEDSADSASSDEDVADIGAIMPQPETEKAEESSEEPEFEGLSEEDQEFFRQLEEDSLFR